MSTGPGVVQKMQRHNERARDQTKRKDGGQNEVSQRTSNRHTSNCSTGGDLKEIIRPKEEARPLQSDEQEPNPVEELRWRINQLEKEKLELTSKSNQQASCYEAQLARCRALLEKGEAQRQTLEYELALVKRDATAQNSRSEDKLTELIQRNQKLEGLSAELRQRASDLQKALELTQRARDEDERGLRAELRERDHLIHSISAEKEQLHEEKVHLETLLQEQKDTLQDVKDGMDRLERERQRHAEELRVKASELKRGADREKKTKKELEAAMQKIKTLEQGVESERVAHLESKFSAEVIQVRLRDLEAALSVEKRNHVEAASDLQLLKQKFGEVEKAHMLERERADNSQHTLQQLEKEYLSTKAELIGQLDKTKASSAQLSGQLEQVKAESANLIEQLEQEKMNLANVVGQLEQEKMNLANVVGQLEQEKMNLANVVGQLEQEKMNLANVVGQLEQEKMKSADMFGQLEEEKMRSVNLIGQLELEKTKTAMIIGQLEQEKAESAKLLLRLQKLESLQTESTQELSLVRQRNVFLEEAHETLLKEFVQLLEHYNHQGAPPITTTEDGDQLNLSALMDMLRRTLHHCHTELKDLLKVVDVLKKESKEKEKLINEQKRHIQECEMRSVRVTDEAEHLRASLGDATAAAERAQSELRSVTHHYEQEKERLAHTKTQMHTLTQQHDKQQQERLAFLHSLYQQLIAGSVFVTPAQSMMGSFSWAELSTILQEHADMVISDLNSANQKILSLESVCDGKTGALKSVCEQLKQREERWIKEREELDAQHTRLINELHARAQDLRRCLNKTEESLRTSERARSALQQEANRIQDLVRRCRLDDRSLLAACALLAGCVCALHRRVCALVYQKAALGRRSRWAESLERDAGALLHALGDGRVKEHARLRGALWRFRVCVITVMGALRLRTLLRTSNTLFRLAGGVCVSRLRLSEGSEQGEEEEENKGVMKMLRSSELRVIIHSSMQGMQKELQNTEDSECLRTAARSSFTKLMEKLLPEMHSDCKGCYGDVGSLSQQLSRGLNKLRKTHRLPPRHDTNKLILSALQQHFLLYTQRLHSAEVERRDLRIELARLRLGNTKKHGQPKDDAHSDPKDETHNACVPVEQFRSVWTELSSALQREQQAQGLLHEQASQLRELSLTMEIHTREQLEKDQTLAQAVQSLSEAKAQLKRKDKSLHLLGKRLNQSDQEKLQLQESITKAEATLQTVARTKECLSSYIKSVEHNLREHRDHLVLSRSTSSWKDFNLHLPTVSMDTLGSERTTEGPELMACKALVRSFTEVYELMCCKMASLEREISSYQSHITALKAELNDACLRENQCYVFGSDDPPAPILKADVHCGTPACSEALVTLKDAPEIERPVQKSLPRKKSKAVKKLSKVTNHKGASKSLK